MIGGRNMPLELLDISFNVSVTPDYINCILNMTHLKELFIWDNPRLPFEEVAKVAKSRIAKVIIRASFLAPLEKCVRQEKWVKQGSNLVHVQPVPPTVPAQICIC